MRRIGTQEGKKRGTGMKGQKCNILVVDDEEPIRRILATQLADYGNVFRASSGEEALEIARTSEIDIVVTDMKMPGMDGITLLRRVQEWNPEILVILLTAYGSIEGAVDAMRLGAFDYLTKPVDIETLVRCIEKAIDVRRLREENAYLREQLGEGEIPEMVGTSAEIIAVKKKIRQAATSDAPVILLGETGTGKGVAARVLHEESGRRGLFVRVNCAALPETMLESELFGHVRGAFTGAVKSRKGKFLLADGGTLFLDEIITLPMSLQAKLLHVLEDGKLTPVGGDRERETSARIVVATNENLEEAVREKRFREDLYWRLNVITITMPSLRSRKEDIPLLLHHFLARFAGDRGMMISPEAIAVLTGREWPGNVRELENAVRRAVILAGKSDVLLPEHFEESIPEALSGMSLKEALIKTERALIAEALRTAQGQKGKAAELLGVKPRMMSYYLSKYPDIELTLRAGKRMR
ncbi:MAG: sigma-54-dependent Fis family transcriptional regulator [Candidatus Hydrogenedentota bacterium]|nr:MAG: sigma-54-dependent Fis family transcriptional regulator [Candidatus Hydrogenedentota bacterium]